MPSDNQKGIEFPQQKNSKQNGGKKHQKKSIGWIIGVVVLILISVTFILPTTALSGGNNSIEFGRYNGEKIELEYGNFFYNQISSLASQYPMDASNSFQIYYQAYYTTVFETALRQMAEQAGIRITDSMVNDAIIQSGYFSNEDGAFDSEVYKNASAVEKSAVRPQIEDVLPSQLVLSDISSVKTSKAESDFVASLNANTRAFEYITVGAATYPDTEAWTYAEENPAPFQTMDLSILTVATEDEANTILTSIQNGEKTFESAVAESSTDSYKDAEGEMGRVMLNSLEGQLVDSTNATTIFSGAVGDVMGPFQTYSGYALYRINSETAAADLEEIDNLNAVKNYIAAHDAETMNAYLETKADEVYQTALTNWDDATAVYGVTVTEVGAAAPNPASSSMINGIALTDPDYRLANAAGSNEDFNKEIFTSEIGSVASPVQSGNAYIIVRSVESEGTSDLQSSYLTSLYPSFFVPYVTQSDLQSSVMTSEGFEDNFLNTYFSSIVG